MCLKSSKCPCYDAHMPSVIDAKMPQKSFPNAYAKSNNLERSSQNQRHRTVVPDNVLLLPRRDYQSFLTFPADPTPVNPLPSAIPQERIREHHHFSALQCIFSLPSTIFLSTSPRSVPPSLFVEEEQGETNSTALSFRVTAGEAEPATLSVLGTVFRNASGRKDRISRAESAEDRLRPSRARDGDDDGLPDVDADCLESRDVDEQASSPSAAVQPWSSLTDAVPALAHLPHIPSTFSTPPSSASQHPVTFRPAWVWARMQPPFWRRGRA